MSFDRKRYAREYARRQRAARRAAREAGTARCGTIHCGGRLEAVTDGAGRVTLTCPRCARRRAGRCIECGARTGSRAWRCAPHKRLADVVVQERYREGHRRELRRKSRERARTECAQRAEYRRLWTLANPERVKRQKRRTNARRREEMKAYLQAYRAAGRERPRTGSHPCVACGAALTGRAKKCAACVATQKRQAREALTARCVPARERAA